MKQNSAIGSTLLAVAASLCCILPLALAAGGFEIADKAVFFKAMLPFFLIVLFALLVLGLYAAYRKPRGAFEPGSACSQRPVSRYGRIALWTATALVAGFAAYYYG